jgi:ABC-type transporter Mla subunit MlaD
MLSLIKTYGLACAAVLSVTLLAVQTGRLHSEKLAHKKLKVSVAESARQRTEVALKVTESNTAKVATHAEASTENANVLLTELKAQRDAATAVAARHERMLRDADRRAATYRAMSEAGAAACRDLANQHETFDRHIVEGVKVVADLGTALASRDAEVKALRAQIDTDRALATP